VPASRRPCSVWCASFPDPAAPPLQVLGAIYSRPAPRGPAPRVPARPCAALRALPADRAGRQVGGLAPDFAAARVALETVRSMLARIAAAPREARFRRVRLDNGAFRARVGRHAGGKELLLAANFRRSGDGSALECAAGPAELAVAASLFDAALDALP
jgi:hypothetical protein